VIDKEAAFRERYRAAIDELEELLDDEAPRFYDFGLNRPADPATPGAPLSVHATPIGGGKSSSSSTAPAAPAPSATTNKSPAPTPTPSK
jgi:hypothetical protein